MSKKSQLLNKYTVKCVAEIVYELDIHADSSEEAGAIASALCEIKQEQLNNLNIRCSKFNRAQTILVLESKFNKSKIKKR